MKMEEDDKLSHGVRLSDSVKLPYGIKLSNGVKLSGGVKDKDDKGKPGTRNDKPDDGLKEDDDDEYKPNKPTDEICNGWEFQGQAQQRPDNDLYRSRESLAIQLSRMNLEKFEILV